MTCKTTSLRVLLLSFSVTVGVAPLYAANPAGTASASGPSQQTVPDVRGTWSGTFFSKHSNVPPFTITVVISPNSSGHLVGSLNSECLTGAPLEVTVAGSTIVLAGSDEEGDSITVRGTVDSTAGPFKNQGQCVSYVEHH
jgi:hypothetical protein